MGSGLGFDGSGGGGAGAAGRGAPRSGSADALSCWYAQKLMVWGLPSSVMTKSLAVRPSMGLPLLSLMVTTSMTSWLLLVNLATPSSMAFGGAAAGGC